MQIYSVITQGIRLKQVLEFKNGSVIRVRSRQKVGNGSYHLPAPVDSDHREAFFEVTRRIKLWRCPLALPSDAVID